MSDLDASGFDEYEKRLIGDWFSNNISGRQCICLLQAKWLHEKSKNSNGENKRVLKNKNVFGYEFKGERFDCGSKLGFIKANLGYGLLDNEIKLSLDLFKLFAI